MRDVVEVEVAVPPFTRHRQWTVDVAALVDHVLAATSTPHTHTQTDSTDSPLPGQLE